MKQLWAGVLFTILTTCTLAQVPNVAPLPTGMKDGINYLSGTSVLLSLRAPGKNYVHLIGDFNDWEVGEGYLLNKTPDGERHWIQIEGLTPNTEYRFQYFVDGLIRVGDPYADKFIDSWTDQDIDSQTYPGLLAYPFGLTSFPVSVLETNQVPYPWVVDDFTPPQKEKMVIYEMCIRDFVGTHKYATVMDTLDYLENLGINVLQLMPVTDFDGNNSWGYNPNYYFAPDKYYGTKNELKALIDACHQRGIAVVLDMVLNHSWGQNPLVRLYWDDYPVYEPTAENPWFNVGCNFSNTNACFGPDYNHESTYTQAWVDTVNHYWMSEYKVDGFRFDFTKGYTNSYKGPNDPWGDAYDAGRIATLKRMADAIWAFDPDKLVILEHLSFNNQEERELANHGMLMWSSYNYHFTELIKGYNFQISWMDWRARNWDAPNVVAYWNSHDWQRPMYEALTNGRSNANYDVKVWGNAIKRLGLCAAFCLSVPGPKMIWQFEELAYDVNVNQGGYGSPQPIKWHYFAQPGRRALYDGISDLLYLKKNFEVFSTHDFGFSIDGITKSLQLNADDMNVTIVGNFDIVNRNVVPHFQHTGIWYDYLTGLQVNVTNLNASYSIAPGEVYIMTDSYIPRPSLAAANAGVYNTQPALTEAGTTTQPKITAFPNPGRGLYSLQFMEGAPESIQLMVSSADGREVLSFTAYPESDMVIVDLSAYPSGLYIVQCTAASVSRTLKLMKL